MVFLEVSHGFGKTLHDIPPAQVVPLQKVSKQASTNLDCYSHIGKTAYAGDILYVITLYVTKLSAATFFLRLSPDRLQNLLTYAIGAASTIFMVVSIFIVAFKCDNSHPWLFIGEKCTTLVCHLFPRNDIYELKPLKLVRWDVVGAFDIVTELALFLSSILLVKGLQLSFSKKCVVIMAFAFRLP
jgi:uncharacterized membrane protein